MRHTLTVFTSHYRFALNSSNIHMASCSLEEVRVIPQKQKIIKLLLNNKIKKMRASEEISSDALIANGDDGT